jgi:hypothetical protein
LRCAPRCGATGYRFHTRYPALARIRRRTGPYTIADSGRPYATIPCVYEILFLIISTAPPSTVDEERGSGKITQAAREEVESSSARRRSIGFQLRRHMTRRSLRSARGLTPSKHRPDADRHKVKAHSRDGDDKSERSAVGERAFIIIFPQHLVLSERKSPRSRWTLTHRASCGIGPGPWCRSFGHRSRWRISQRTLA